MPKILIIDDDLLFLEVIQDLLTFHGFQVIAAKNGRLGLQLAQDQTPDLIISDISMPEFNGYELLKALRKNSVTQNIPVILITGDGTDSIYLAARELGANDCLTKPYSIEQLIQTIEVLLKE
jgi:CheY-like chemotaxis protein